MNFGSIKKRDIANGWGVRVSLFVSGCRRHCKNCFNPETWNFGYGSPFTAETEQELLDALSPGFINGLTVLGGEPFEPENQRELLPLLRQVKKRFPNKDIWCFTGGTLEKDLAPDGQNYCGTTEEMLQLIDVLVDGAFIEELKDITLQFRGSSNQRLIDLPRTLRENHIVLWQPPS